MSKLVLSDPSSFQASILTTISSNNTSIETALENTLSRDGTSPNHMQTDLDMNGNSILNLPDPTQPTDPVRLQDLQDLILSENPGSILGPISSTDNALVRFDGTSGKVIQNSSASLSDTGGLTLNGQITSTVTTGAAPLVVASTTQVANFNASSLGGATFASPGAIGGTAASAGTFTTLTGTGGTHTGITSLGLRDTSAVFDVTVAATSSTTLTAGRSFTLDMGNAAHTLKFGTSTGTVTFPTGTVTLVDSTVTTLSSLASIGTITTGVWNAGTITSSGAISGTTLTATGTLSIGGISSFADGASDTPSITFTSDTDTGLYHVGSNRFAATAGGNPTLDISSSGLVINGTLAPTGVTTFSSTVALTPMTSGSVLFAGTSGVISQDSSNLSWNATNHLLTIKNPSAAAEGAIPNPTSLFIVAGSSGAPVTTDVATLTVSRRELNNVATTNASAGYFHTTNTGSGQPVGIYGSALNSGTGDAVGIFGIASASGSAVKSAFGAYLDARADSATTGAIALEATVTNNSGANRPYSPVVGNNLAVGIDLDYGATAAKLGSVAIQIRSSSQWDVGIGFMQGDFIKTASIQDDTSSITLFLANSGSHTNGINLTGATFSGNPFASTGFSVNSTGVVTGTQIKSTISGNSPDSLGFVASAATRQGISFVDTTASTGRNFAIVSAYNTHGTLEFLYGTSAGAVPTTTGFSLTSAGAVSIPGTLTVGGATISLAASSALNWNSSNVTLTHSTNALTLLASNASSSQLVLKNSSSSAVGNGLEVLDHNGNDTIAIGNNNSTDKTFVWNFRNSAMNFGTNNTLRGSIGATGGLSWGAPTGGDKGSGNVNLAGALYANNTQVISSTGAGTFTALTDSAITSGSVLFAGTGGLLSQRNANFAWDDTNQTLSVSKASSAPEGGLTATTVMITAGSAANPITEYIPTFTVSRREQLDTINIGNQAAALFHSTNNGAAQPIGVYGSALNHGPGDACAVFGYAAVDGSAVKAAFGGYFAAVAGSANTGAIAIESTTNNSSGFDNSYNPITGNKIIGYDIDYVSDPVKIGACAIQIRAGNGQWDVGIGFIPGCIKTATIQDDTNSVTILKAASGSHTNGIDLSSATFSGSPFKSTGFSVDANGLTTVTRSDGGYLIKSVGSGAGQNTYGFAVTGGGVGDFVLDDVTASVTRIQVTKTTGTVVLTNDLVVGSATGGAKGNGSINIAADIYKNNTAYTNPDFVFEHFYNGSIGKFSKSPGASDYTGLLPLSKLRDHTRTTLRLPGISDEPLGMFERGDVALRLIEENTLYILDLHERLSILERAVAERNINV